MKISNIVSSAAAGVFALGMTASVASAETCVVALPFDFGSAAVSATNQGLLDVIRARYSNATVDLAGYTDAVGSAASNQALSNRRAATVSAYLTNGTSITVNNSTGFGESNLKVNDPGPNILNRRVEVTISDICNPADFGGVPGAAVAGLGGVGSAGAIAGILGAALVIGALGSDGATATTTTTTTGLGNGAGN